MSYNEIGQLKNKELHSTNDGTSFLSKSTYSYNARGWLVGQASPLFNMTLKYEDNIVPQFNGNISKQEWGPAATPMLHNYAYSYDNLNRLKSGTSDEGFNESLVYDKMGNISSLTRNPMGTNTYIYKGNQLKSISGFVNGDYEYDVNGNMITDGSKNISIGYNYLNLPEFINKAGEQMQNTWLANGTKLKKTVGGLTREYVGGIEYNNGIVEFIQTEEGRARPNDNSYFYEYMLKDHLGNTRVMFDQNGTVLESSDYYPFGLQVARASNTVPSPENRYKYNSKELQTELGLMQYDYGARFYDPVIGRWNVIDPLAEDYDDLSPYNYGMNNPILMIDPDGMSSDTSKVIKPEPEPIQLEEVAIVLAIDRGVIAGGQKLGPWGLLPVGGYFAGKWMSKDENIHKTAAFMAFVLEKLGVDRKYLYPAEAKDKEKSGSGTPRKKSPETLRKEWEKATGKTWPTEPSDPTKKQVAHHKKALADGGYDGMPNIEPLPAAEHRKLHKDNGDFTRWRERRNN